MSLLASYNFEYDSATVTIGLVAAILALVLAVKSPKWWIAVFGTSLAWSMIAMFMVVTGSGDMGELLLLPLAVLGAMLGAIAGGVNFAVKRKYVARRAGSRTTKGDTHE